MFNLGQIFQYSVVFPLTLEEKNSFDKCHLELPASLHKAHSNRKDQFLLGRYCAIQALFQAGFVETFNICINKDGSPKWPKGFVGSITHTENYIGAVVGFSHTYQGLGIDSQMTMSEKTFKNIHKKILLKSELNINLKGWSQSEIATLIFSFKESIFKCFRPLCGKFFGFHDAEILEINLVENSIKFKLLNDIGNGFGNGYVGTGHFIKENLLIHTICSLDF